MANVPITVKLILSGTWNEGAGTLSSATVTPDVGVQQFGRELGAGGNPTGPGHYTERVQLLKNIAAYVLAKLEA